jgi:dipeptidyl aminopeptidase/acylaminoacyl peptidase
MYFRSFRYSRAVLCAATLALAACGSDGPTTPAAGQVRVAVSTIGPDMDPDGYTLTLDDTASAVVQSNGVATFPNVSAGQHSVAMTGLALNCSAAAVPPVDVAPGVIADVSANVTCVQLVGALRVTAPTTGVDPDVAYLLYVDQDVPRLLLANDTLAFPILVSGNHALRIAGVSPNCAVAGSVTQTAVVTFGTTNVVRFDVACTPRVSLVLFSSTRGDTVDPYHSINDLYTMTPTGANVVRLTTQAAGLHAAWSPDGGKIAYHSVAANGRFDIHVINADGSNDVQLTTDPQDDVYPQWSPDGTQIAFERSVLGTSTRGVWVMNADGSGQRAVKLNNAGHPSWSPDGARIAFDGVIASGTADIYSIRLDGTDLVQLTHSTTFAISPRWSPDGRRILFICHDGAASTDLFVMAADGSGVVNLTRDPNGNFSEDESWSPDGQWIAFRSNRNGGNPEIYVMKADGTGATNISQSGWDDSGSDWHP